MAQRSKLKAKHLDYIEGYYGKGLFSHGRARLFQRSDKFALEVRTVNGVQLLA